MLYEVITVFDRRAVRLANDDPLVVRKGILHGDDRVEGDRLFVCHGCFRVVWSPVAAIGSHAGCPLYVNLRVSIESKPVARNEVVGTVTIAQTGAPARLWLDRFVITSYSIHYTKLYESCRSTESEICLSKRDL